MTEWSTEDCFVAKRGGEELGKYGPRCWMRAPSRDAAVAPGQQALWEKGNWDSEFGLCFGARGLRRTWSTAARVQRFKLAAALAHAVQALGTHGSAGDFARPATAAPPRRPGDPNGGPQRRGGPPRPARDGEAAARCESETLAATGVGRIAAAVYYSGGQPKK